jgi:hypothetical protein
VCASVQRAGTADRNLCREVENMRKAHHISERAKTHRSESEAA